MVWGARTLKGNDKEWRYIPVKRFFLMVEESVRKGISSFQFEKNEPLTWNNLKSLVFNFLYQLWKSGAFMGAKPEHAFFVKVGLGETMTNQDILDGRMNVEIGMAAVRPAEFIILRIVQHVNIA